ncbi:ACT domain-containing protein [Geobacter grbiciae]|uniref:ACT domain-containing protein n=1 Tax=Geobacter grbiciae TaxID=155042 RepID=UPI001C0208C8|nr:ACT domain-containing protein [Geobacter grbiciae]MBT1074196.1 amino acid-binding protein [Geobacter grbiciae]
MKLKQLSVFLDNAPGRLHEATQALGDAGINLRSLSICDTAGFGILRILVSDVAKARKVMMEKQIPARVDDVVAVEIDDVPGSLSGTVLKLFLDSQINVDYMYAFAGTGPSAGKAVMIFRFSDNDRAIGIMQGSNIKILDAESFGMLENPS